MNKLREIDKRTHHLKGRIIISGDRDYPSATADFLRKLEEKILEECKDFKSCGIVLEFIDLEIK
jgi:hypothetical protein